MVSVSNHDWGCALDVREELEDEFWVVVDIRNSCNDWDILCIDSDDDDDCDDVIDDALDDLKDELKDEFEDDYHWCERNVGSRRRRWKKTGRRRK